MGPPWLSLHLPTVMAVVNLNADSFSDPRGGPATLDEVRAQVRSAAAAGAAVVDLGAESASLVAAQPPVVEQVATVAAAVTVAVGAGAVVSVDTYRPEVASAALEAGATIVNDYSGRADPALLAAVVEHGGWYVLTHNPLGPRRRPSGPDHHRDVVDEVTAWFDDRLASVTRAGVDPERVILDPGVDLAKTPRQTLRLLRGAGVLRARFEQPLLWAISRKDVLGVLLQRSPSGRDAATAAVVAWLGAHPRTLLRVHDARAAGDVLTVVDALRGGRDIDAHVRLDDHLRREG